MNIPHLSDRARRTLQLANQEADRFNHEYIGSEHVLLGIIKDTGCVGSHILKSLNIDLRKVRLEVEKIVQSGPDMMLPESYRRGQTPRVKKVLEYAGYEAKNMGHAYVSTEHILLGLMREEDGVAYAVLSKLGVEKKSLYEATHKLLSQQRGESRLVELHKKSDITIHSLYNQMDASRIKLIEEALHIAKNAKCEIERVDALALIHKLSS